MPHKIIRANNLNPYKEWLTEKDISDGVSSDGKKRIWKGIRLRNENDPTFTTDKTTDTAKLTDNFRQDLQESPLYKEKQKDFTAKPVRVVSNVSKCQ